MSNPKDFFDTSYESVSLEIQDNKLAKGDEVNITEKDPRMKKIIIGVGWDLLPFEGTPVDMDVSCFLLDRNDKTRVNEDFVFYNNLSGCNGAVEHTGDNRTGAVDGDDETITISLNDVPFDILRLVFVISVYRAEDRDHSLSKLRNAYIRLLNFENMQEICKYDFSADVESAKESGMLAAALERNGPKWHFKALGEAVEGGLAKIATNYDIIVQTG